MTKACDHGVFFFRCGILPPTIAAPVLLPWLALSVRAFGFLLLLPNGAGFWALVWLRWDLLWASAAFSCMRSGPLSAAALDGETMSVTG